MTICKECQDGYMPNNLKYCTINSQGDHHSFDDKPAFEYTCGFQYWYKNGKEHREKGPAIIYSARLEEHHWYLNGVKAIKIPKQEMYTNKVIQVKNKTTIILEQITDDIWEVLQGDRKFLVVPKGIIYGLL